MVRAVAGRGVWGHCEEVWGATAAVDSSGLCVFTTFAWTLEDIAPQVDAACEGNWTVDKMLEAGERIWNMERIFNNKAGFTAADDNLPQRLLKILNDY